jgi:hypothetical protein
MTQEQKRIKLAEVAGWKPYPSENVGPAARFFNGDIWFRHAESYTIATPEQLPDYFNDLNAVHELESTLGEKQTRLYAFILAQVLDTSPTVDLDDQFLNIHATAAQRAEALGKTLNLW